MMQAAPVQFKLQAQNLRWHVHEMSRPSMHPTRQALKVEVTGSALEETIEGYRIERYEGCPSHQ